MTMKKPACSNRTLCVVSFNDCAHDHSPARADAHRGFPFLKCLLILAAFVICFRPTHAQTPTVDQGVNPYSTLHGGDLDSVSLQNSALLLHIPLLSYPQRGDLHLGFTIAYDNHEILSNVNCTQYCTTAWYVQGVGVHIMADLPWVNSTPVNGYLQYKAFSADGTGHPMV